MYHSFPSWTRGSAKGGARVKRSVLVVFLIAEALLYGLFLFLDLQTAIDTKWLKFASILFVALMSIYADEKLLSAALCLTAAADIFLLVLDRRYDIGIFLFILVQLLYSLHLKSRKILCIQIVLLIISAALAAASRHVEALAAGYITIFLLNLIHAGSCAFRKGTKTAILFFAGLFLFFCCDLCVGYYNIGSGFLWSFARVAMWGFYLPGQVLILLSNIKNQGETI